MCSQTMEKVKIYIVIIIFNSNKIQNLIFWEDGNIYFQHFQGFVISFGYSFIYFIFLYIFWVLIFNTFYMFSVFNCVSNIFFKNYKHYIVLQECIVNSFMASNSGKKNACLKTWLYNLIKFSVIKQSFLLSFLLRS